MDSKEDHHDAQYEVNEFKCYGFLREVLNNRIDYASIVSIIIQYCQQGYAKYFDETIDKDYVHKMRFGDIVRIKKAQHSGTYECLNFDGSMIDVGDDEISDDFNDILFIDIDIPFNICKNLDNAHSFYSKLASSIKA